MDGVFEPCEGIAQPGICVGGQNKRLTDKSFEKGTQQSENVEMYIVNTRQRDAKSPFSRGRWHRS